MAETLAVHSIVTIDSSDAIKWNLRNVKKWLVFAQRVTNISHKNFYHALLL